MRTFHGVALAGALLCFGPNVPAQQGTGTVSALTRIACAAEAHCPPAWTDAGVTPAKVRALLGLDPAAARQRLLQDSALWSPETWRCAARGQDCPAGTTQRSAQIMIPLPPDALRAVQQVLAGGSPAPIAAAPAATPALTSTSRPATDAAEAQDQGSAACFNPDLFRPGTHYLQYEVARAPDGSVEHLIRDNTVEKVSNSDNAADAVIVRGTFATDPNPRARNPVASTYSVGQTAAGPVYYHHRTIMRHEATRLGSEPAAETDTVYSPPAVFGHFALQPGQSHTHTTTASTRRRRPGREPAVEEKTTSTTMTYVGRRQVTTELGTFDTCHFTLDGRDYDYDYDYDYIVGMGLPLRAGNQELHPDSHVNGVPLSAWVR